MANMILAILQARFSSSRLPGKVLKPILGKAMLLHQIERLQHSKMIGKLVVATSIDDSDNEIERMCLNNNITVFRGDLNNVLDRFYKCAKIYNPKHIVRLTGDCPLADWQVLDKTIKHHLDGDYDYTNNCIIPVFPDGLDVEIMKNEVLKMAWNKASLPSEKEHVTYYINQRKDEFKIGYFNNQEDLRHLRWTVDEPEDFIFVEKIYQNLYKNNPNFLMNDILKLLEKEPELLKINNHFEANEGMKKSLEEDELYLFQNLSVELGNDISQVQGGGGNTSIKYNNKMLVKASGYWLSDANVKNIFVEVDYQKIQSTINSNIEVEMNDYVIGTNNLKPSIETLLHAILPYKIVIHTHSISAISWSIREDAINELKNLLAKFNWAFIDYKKPGLELAQEISAKIKHTNIDVLVLANHGLVVAGNTLNETKIKLKKIEKYLQSKSVKKLEKIKYKLLENIVKDTDYKIIDDNLIHNIVMNDKVFSMIKKGVLYPDHVVFLGDDFVVIHNRQELLNILKNNKLLPRVIYILGVGVVVINDISQGAIAMLSALALVSLRIDENIKYNYLTNTQVLELLNWNAEKYRKNL